MILCKKGDGMDKTRNCLASYDPEISKLFFMMSLIIPVTLILAVLFYRDTFHFLRNAFSQLGETVTPQGAPNLTSRLVFSAGFMSCGIAMFNISSRYRKNRDLRNRSIKQLLALAGGVGFFVAVTPNDISHSVHSVGMGTAVAVTYFFGTIFLLELRPRIPAFTFYANMVILQTSVLTYATAFFADSSYNKMAQKLCVVGLLLVMERAVTIAPEGFEWRAVFEAIRK